MARSMKEVHTINYYPINEGAARRAKEMNSFSDYKEGSATAEYRAMVDKAAAIAEQQKSRADPMYHEKIDHLLDTYARKLAENMNQGFAIDTRVPSVMIAGPANFPVGKKEKQNRARDSNMEEWRYIQGLLDKIRSTGMGGISADDPAAIEKLQKKLDGLERSQLIMKEVNAYYRNCDPAGGAVCDPSSRGGAGPAPAPAVAALFSCVGGKLHLPHAWQRPCQCVIRHLLRLGGYGPAGGGRGLHSAGKRAGADGSEHRKHPSRL